MEDKSFIRVLGWLATISSLAMYFSYIDQIMLNLDGVKGSVIQPAAATISTILWASYGFLRKDRDWPLVCANLPGIVLGGCTFVTAL